MKVSTLTIGLLFFTVFILFSISACACDCGLQTSKLSIKKQVRNANERSVAVFSGTVIEINEDPLDLIYSVRFRVTSQWKGSQVAAIYINTGKGSGDCGFPFELNKEYLVYAFETSDTKLSTNICDRTALLSEAQADIAVLGKPKAKT